ncbi:MAG: hypothetical protein K8R02_08900 [Anaerohalosphaeraceae bacterium]|nr:hypothetical protein [Anaerohalosphaeraceae bacterium]
MGRKNGSLLELLVDKIVLAVAGIICLLVFFVFILGNPNSAKYRGRTLGTGEIDREMKKRSVELADELSVDPNTDKVYEPKKPEYLALVKNSIKNVDIARALPVAGYVKPVKVAENRVYRMPQLPDVNFVSITGIKMAAFVPIEKLDEVLSYEAASTVLEDLYFITVESRIDLSKLYTDFYDSFVGTSVKAAWREEKYSKPVFAKVELQRRNVLVDGSFGDWELVPRTKIFNLEKTLQLPKQANQYEIEIAMHNFSSNFSTLKEILQPSVYDNAIPSEQWLSPSFYNQRQKRLADELEQQRRAEIEAERAERLRERATRASERDRRQPTSNVRGGATDGRGMTGGMGDEMMGGAGRAPAREVRSRRTAGRREPRTAERPTGRRAAEVKLELNEAEKFAAIQLLPDTELSNLDKLYFWAHDDTAENGKSYQYRMRIGVLNPIAGKDWFSQDQQGLKDKMVLWSNYSEPSEIASVPQSVYFFPTDVRQVRRGDSAFDKMVEIKAARYTLGNWVSQTFNVRCGEEIGKVVSATGSRLAEAEIDVDTIDFSTGAVMTDTESATEWTGAGVLRPRAYEELVYGLIDAPNTLKRIPIKQRNWPSDLSSVFDEIKEAEKLPPVQLLDRSAASSGQGPTRTSPVHGPGDTGDMMMGMPGMF